MPDDRAIGDDPAARGIKLSVGRQIYDPADPMDKMSFNIFATFAEFEVDLLRMRTKRAWQSPVPRAKLRGKQPVLSARQQRELVRMYGTGEYSLADLTEVFGASRTTVYRTFQRASASEQAGQPGYLSCTSGQLREFRAVDAAQCGALASAAVPVSTARGPAGTGSTAPGM